jgi:hypothetical protein
MMDLKKIIITCTLIFFAPTSFADNSALTSAAAASVKKNSAQLQSTQAEAIRDTTSTTSSSNTAQNTINHAADQGRRSQNAGMIMNMIASAALFASCFASTPPNMALCAMGALAAAQGANQGQSAGMSDMTFDASQYNPGDFTGTGADGTGTLSSVDGTGTAGFTDPIIKEGMGKLSEAGYKISEDGVTNPDGSFTPASAFDSPSSMMAAGMSAQTASAAGDVMDTIKKELEGAGANVVAMGVDTSGGGGGGYGGGAGGADFGDLSSFKLPSLKNPFDNADKKKLVAGKALMVGGEPIGVKGDNIFDMVHRAYQKKRGRNQFLETTKGPARLPASMTENGNPL